MDACPPGMRRTPQRPSPDAAPVTKSESALPRTPTSGLGQGTKSLRDSPLRGAGALIKLNPLSTEQGYIGMVLTWIEESNAT